MAHRRPTDHRIVTAVATCDGCSTFRVAGAGALGAGARHHDATGHRVTIEQETRTVYGDAGSPDAPTLLDAIDTTA